MSNLSDLPLVRDALQKPMKVRIEYKSDCSQTPFCAFTRINGVFSCQWSSKSFEDAKAKLLTNIQATKDIKTPEPEEVEL